MFRKCVVAILLFSAISFCQTAPTSSVPPSRLAHIRHGVNLSEWFAQVYDPKGYTKEHFETWTTSTDIALIKSAGFDHVRLSVNPQPMMDAAWRQRGSEEYFSYLDAAMKMILDAGLAVELDMHPDPTLKPSWRKTMTLSSASPISGASSPNTIRHPHGIPSAYSSKSSTSRKCAIPIAGTASRPS